MLTDRTQRACAFITAATLGLGVTLIIGSRSTAQMAYGTEVTAAGQWHFYQDIAPWTAAISGNQSDLTQITSDRDTGVSVLSFVVDPAGIVQGIAFATTSSAVGNTSTQNFSLADIQSGHGVVLMQAQGHDVFFLQGTIDSVQGQGDMTIRYLANGLWGTYKDCPAKVGRTADGVWHIFNSATGKIVNAAKVQTWSMGVTTVHGICTPDAND